MSTFGIHQSRRIFRWGVAASLFVAACAVGGVAQADSGDMIEDFITNTEAALDSVLMSQPPIVIQPDGKILTTTDDGLIRFNADGTADTTFNDNTPNDATKYGIIGLAPDGKIFVASNWNGDRLMRLNSDGTPEEYLGSPDTRFYADDVSMGGTHKDIFVFDDGSVLIASDSSESGTEGEAGYISGGLAKFDSDGSPDWEFNSNVSTAFKNSCCGGLFAASDIAVSEDGDIYAANEIETDAGTTQILKFDEDGVRDLDFDAALGEWLPESPSISIWDLTIAADGDILATGSISSDGCDGEITRPNLLPKINPDGTPDQDFNEKVEISVSGGLDCLGDDYTYLMGTAMSVAVDAFGEIIVAGATARETIDSENTADGGAIRFADDGQILGVVGADDELWSTPGMVIQASAAIDPLTNDVVVVASDVMTSAPFLRRYEGTPLPTSDLTVSVSGSGSGSVSSSPAGIDSSLADLTATFNEGSEVQLTAEPEEGSVFTSWSDDVVCDEGQDSTLCTFEMGTENVTVTATFDLIPVDEGCDRCTDGGGGGSSEDSTETPSTETGGSDSAPPPVISPSESASPSLVTGSNADALEAPPGTAEVLINGAPVEVAVETVAATVASIPSDQRSPEQVAAIQQAAAELINELNALVPEGSANPLEVENTSTGAVINGLVADPNDPTRVVPVPVERVVVVDADQSKFVLATVDASGRPAEVGAGGILQVTQNGDVAATAYGLPANQTGGEIVVMSDPLLLGTFSTDASGTFRGQVSLPSSIGSGNHTVVLALPGTSVSVGLQVNQLLLPKTGSSGSDGLTQLALWLVTTGIFVSALRRRRGLVA